MAPATSTNRKWIDVGVSLGKSPGRAFKWHFSSKFHEKSVIKRKMMDEASSKGKERNLLTMLREMSMTTEERSISKNIVFVKVCLRAVNHIVHSVFPNQSLGSLIELIASCGSEEVRNHLLTCARNATYTSGTMFTKYLQVLNDYIEEPLLVSLRSSDFFAIFHDDTTDLSNHSQAAIYMMFEHKGDLSEHFIALKNMTPLGGLTAKDLFTGIDEVAEEKMIDLKKNAFSEMDGAPVNEGDEKGLKTYFISLNPFHIHETCNSHGLALILKHEITNSEKYNCIQAADRLALHLYTFFNDSSLRTSVLENVQLALGLKVYILICPSATRWLSHWRCFCRVILRYPQIVVALATIWQTRGDAAAYGLLLLMLKPEMVMACLLLCDILCIMNPLVLWLQSSPSSIDVTELDRVVQMTVSKLRVLTQSPQDMEMVLSTKELEEIVCKESKFDELMAEIEDVSIHKFPTIERRSSSTLTFARFKETIHDPFIMDIANEIENKIKPSPMSASFRCLDVRQIPDDKKALRDHGMDDLEELKQFYGNGKTSKHPISGMIFQADPLLDKHSLSAEYDTYKRLAVSFRKQKDNELTGEITLLQKKLKQTLRIKPNVKEVERIQTEIADLQERYNKTHLREMYQHVIKSENTAAIIPNIVILMKLALLCPLGNAVVERLFSLMSLIKTRLRTSLLDITLERLLRVNKEGPKELSEEDLSALVDRLRSLLLSESQSSSTRLKF